MNNEKLKIKAELAASIFHDITSEGVPGDNKVIERVANLTNGIIEKIEQESGYVESMIRLKEAVISRISNPMTYGLENPVPEIAKYFDQIIANMK